MYATVNTVITFFGHKQCCQMSHLCIRHPEVRLTYHLGNCLSTVKNVFLKQVADNTTISNLLTCAMHHDYDNNDQQNNTISVGHPAKCNKMHFV